MWFSLLVSRSRIRRKTQSYSQQHSFPLLPPRVPARLHVFLARSLDSVSHVLRLMFIQLRGALASHLCLLHCSCSFVPPCKETGNLTYRVKQALLLHAHKEIKITGTSSCKCACQKLVERVSFRVVLPATQS